MALAPPRAFSLSSPILSGLTSGFAQGLGPCLLLHRRENCGLHRSFLFFGVSWLPEIVLQEANISSKQRWETKLGRGFHRLAYALFISLARIYQPQHSSYILMMLPRCGASTWLHGPTRTAAKCPAPRSIRLCRVSGHTVATDGCPLQTSMHRARTKDPGMFLISHTCLRRVFNLRLVGARAFYQANALSTLSTWTSGHSVEKMFLC